LVQRHGSLGRIRLNRPKALNSLTIGMVRTIRATLDDFAGDDAVAAVLIDGCGERGLCAGGDIRALYENGKSDYAAAAGFFREEYDMNAAIAAFPKPYVAFMDGITMGGGVGISAHGAQRVVTETTRLAMPETGIGFFPDVGASWLLARATGEIGTYLGLTGAQIGGADAIYAGLADVLVTSATLPALAEALAALPPGGTGAAVGDVLRGFAQTVQASLAAQRNVIDATFNKASVPEIVAALLAEGSPFALATANTIGERSPTGLCVALRLLRLARRSASLGECLEREYVAACRVLKGDDFYEGVRAAIIDKDRHPKWRPARLDEVTDVMVAEYAPS
jgi:enoyl-CoA hydratase